jgi:hypothetical protein
MEFSKQRIEELMDQYIQDNEDFGDYSESPLISEVFNGFKPILLETTSNKVSTSILQEHANGLQGVPKDIFEDFVLYINMTELDSRLL